MTRYITNYCVKNEIHTVVIGDIKGIRKERNLGRKTNQKLHSLPYARIYMQLEYKLKMKGICLIRQEESYSSQCPPQSEKVSHIYAEKRNWKKRGICIVDHGIYNVDATLFSIPFLCINARYFFWLRRTLTGIAFFLSYQANLFHFKLIF